MTTTLTMNQGGYFLSRSDGVQEVGCEWPSGAVVDYRPQFVLLGSDGKRFVVRNVSIDDALERAQQMVPDSGGCVRVAKAVGIFGKAKLFQDVATIAAHDFSPPDDAPADRDWFRWRKEHDPTFAKAKWRSLSIKSVTRKGSETLVEGRGHASSLDRDHEVVAADAFRDSLPKYLESNPIMLFGHNPNRPIGTVEDAAIDDGGTVILGRVVDKEIRFLLEEMVLRTFSVGFIPEETAMMDAPSPGQPPILKITKAEMLENSIVAVPANRDATLQVVKSKSISNGVDIACAGCRTYDTCECSNERAIGFKRYPLAEVNEPLDFRPDEIQRRFGKTALRDTATVDHGWGAQGSSYELLGMPHHGLGDGVLKTSPRAVACGLARLVAYQGETAERLDEETRAKAWAHLAAHAEQMWPGMFVTVDIGLPKGPGQDHIGNLFPDTMARERHIVTAADEENVDAVLATLATVKGAPTIQRIEVAREAAPSQEAARSLVQSLGFEPAEAGEEKGDGWCFRMVSEESCLPESFSSVQIQNGVTIHLCTRQGASDKSEPFDMSIGNFIQSLESASEEERSKVASILGKTLATVDDPAQKEGESDSEQSEDEGAEEPAKDEPKEEPESENTDGESDGEPDAEEVEVSSTMLIAMEGVIEAAENGSPINPEMVSLADREMAGLLGVELPEGARREGHSQDEEA